ncbi:MAG: thiamine pyrophosphate-binding protein [Dehalococcoidia bacterium]|nr:thiamine pyrophosphate-binding protein [Dehalococcoidia bacterium]MDP6226215.1 thiamine pyrophosphate-binding protein [Dehalococcoidia bacterium]MDP7083345.1 thiamine pyrophosphate-binding protein [Dehalococcoidia bacterium]MDP7511514.1 thiamine pyrophosphate-binding protein [Dehalococcoidia bacterium]HJN85791.1 thiamine pyrophosphate-binding protein [Dehalococcoidia bacterium]
MPIMSGKHALAQMLLAEGVEYIFGNPGTSESPLLDVLQDFRQLRYVQALQEGSAVGMADGYARATGRPSFANVHIAGGLANGISGLYNAFKGGTPLVLTAGNSDSRMFLTEPVLSGNLVQMAAQYTKWSAEILHASEVPMALRRAFKEAKTPPTGPVFLSLPWDSMDETADVEIIPSSQGYYRTRPDTAAVARASQILAQAENPIIVVGDRVAHSGAVSQVVRVAEQLGAKVYAATLTEVNFPTSHDLYGGMLNLNSPSTRRQFDGVDVVLAVGANVFSSFLYVPDPFLGPATKLIHLDNDSWELEKTYPTEVGILADPAAGLEELADALGQDMSAPALEAAATRAAAWAEEKRRSEEQYRQRLASVWDRKPMPVERMMHELAQASPSDVIIADESVTSRPALMREFSFEHPGDLHGIRGGALGWAMPGALGIKLANPDRPVLAVVGDGASLYTVQALWTAARYNIPVVYAICNNRAYRILKVNMEIYLRRMLDDQDRRSEYTGMEFANPLDLAAIARGMGVAGEKVEDPAALGPALREAYASGKPAVIDVSIDGAL